MNCNSIFTIEPFICKGVQKSVFGIPIKTDMNRFSILALAIFFFAKTSASNIVSGATCFEIVDNLEKTVRLVECWHEGEHYAIPEHIKWKDTAYQVTSISNLAFKRCTSLKIIEIPSSVKSIAISAFIYSTKLEQIVVSKDNTCYCDVDGVLYTADQQTLLYYPRATTINSFHVPENVKTIGTYAFFKCMSLEEVKLPPALTMIGIAAFNGCHRLKSISFPQQLEIIGDYAFYDCPNLLEIRMTAMHLIAFKANTFSYNTYKDGRITLSPNLPPNIKQAYKNFGFVNIVTE